jgi:hypothetical protein
MDKTSDSQLDLFSQSKDYGQQGNLSHSNAFKAFIWHYEKNILIIIALTITSIVSFSLGVEKGKGLSLSKSVSVLDVAGENINIPVNKPAVIEESVKQQMPAQDYIQGFAVQLASYQAKTFAQKEAEALKKRGFTPLILSKGKYTVLYVGTFSKKEEAQSALSQLKKRYDDCFIRRL